MKFFKTVLAVMVGMFLFMVVTTAIVSFFGIIILSVSEEQQVEVKKNTILHLQLNRDIEERQVDDPLAELIAGPAGPRKVGLIELRRAIQHAETDDQIKGIFLEVPYINAGVSSVREIRQMLSEFKDSGKFIIAYGEYFTEGGYYLASVADEIYMAPDFSLLEFNGLNSERIYFKGTLGKLGVEPVIFRHGKYKNAAESFVASEMSETEKVQVEAYVGTLYDHILADISESRGIAMDSLRAIADNMDIRNEQDALDLNFIDDLLYKDEVIKIIKRKVGVDEEKDKIPFIPHDTYNKSFNEDMSSKNTIAVVVAKGNIVTGKGTGDNISSDDFVSEIKKLRENDRVKAIVLRVNSPGGSALASDLIWHEVKLTAQQKPVIASMSDVAASGGYYISMAADTIVAMPTTITGSIGVIGMYFNFNELLNEKLGVTTDNYKTGRYADLLNVTRPVNEAEVLIVQKMIDESYEGFVSKAAEDRGMDFQALDEIAQGRVWSGEDAMAVDLIDVFGNLEDAVQIAAEKAGIANDYKVKYYPAQKTLIEQLVGEIGGDQQTRFIEDELPELEPYLKMLFKIKERTGIQARLPYDLHISF